MVCSTGSVALLSQGRVKFIASLRLRSVTDGLNVKDYNTMCFKLFYGFLFNFYC